jgi:hypothetical protein
MARAKVLVLIPPPVDTGEAPTHIRKIMIKIEGVDKAVILNVLYPAVRGVTL